VRDVDMRLFALPDSAHEGEQIADPYHGQPNVGVPFRLGIFARLGDAPKIARARQHNECIVAPKDEPGQRATEQTPCKCAGPPRMRWQSGRFRRKRKLPPRYAAAASSRNLSMAGRENRTGEERKAAAQ